MRIRVVFDHCVPDSLADDFKQCEVVLARSMGWERRTNGDLLQVLDSNGFNALITIDKGFEHQQNLEGREVGVILLRTHPATPARLALLVPKAEARLRDGIAGQVVVLQFNARDKGVTDE